MTIIIVTVSLYFSENVKLETIRHYNFTGTNWTAYFDFVALFIKDIVKNP